MAAILAMVFLPGRLFGDKYQNISTSQGLEILSGSTVKEVTITEGVQRVEMKLTQPFKFDKDGKTHDKGDKVSFQYVEPQGPDIVKAVRDADPKDGYNSKVPQQSWWVSLLGLVLPIMILVGAFWWLMTRAQGGMGRFAKSKAKVMSRDVPKARFNDVAGVDEAVEELEEIREFLSEPQKFRAVGAKIPRGVLLYGPPGTGKTLLARAVAGEAGVPFFSISGSEFVEMFVGVGASRVRDLFTQAKQEAPAIIFVDEIDAVGRHRGVGLGGGNDEREQTLNQLLVEMDGFDSSTNIILIAATNRPDVLDPALLRPGRFDRQIAVEAPDLAGRTAILRVHAKGKPMTRDVDLEVIARRTPGFTGADLANVLNEAALLTARAGAQLIDNRALDEAIDRVMAGPQKRTRIMNDKERMITAYHEGGHALTAAALHHTDPVTKVTILPRGKALGYTMVMPTEDRFSVTRNELLDQLVYAMGGRVAEEIVFHDPTTGASNDIEKATKTARNMVTKYGMSRRVGTVHLGQPEQDTFLGRETGAGRDYSEDVAEILDSEVRELMDTAHAEAWEILTANRELLDRLAGELLARETLNEKELAQLFADIEKAPKRSVWLFADNRPVGPEVPQEVREIAARGPESQQAPDNHHLAHDDAAAPAKVAGPSADPAPEARPPSPGEQHPENPGGPANPAGPAAPGEVGHGHS